MKSQLAHPNYQIESNGTTVWINSSSGMCVGRFGRCLSEVQGEIHRDYEDQIAGKGQCLDCWHDLAPAKSWAKFVAGMKQHYGVDVPESFRPKYAEAAA